MFSRLIFLHWTTLIKHVRYLFLFCNYLYNNNAIETLRYITWKSYVENNHIYISQIAGVHHILSCDRDTLASGDPKHISNVSCGKKTACSACASPKDSAEVMRWFNAICSGVDLAG